ncbi:MAG: 2-oxoisovalerate dehydrogenase [Bacteroidetes bacterium]|nr:MAG: 2-oxoisovalerate dehydrogenase [Bacteroidota bacterium]
MSEIIFLIEEAPEGGFTTKALGHSIYTESNSIEELKENIKDAVNCHFDDGNITSIIFFK